MKSQSKVYIIIENDMSYFALEIEKKSDSAFNIEEKNNGNETNYF